MSELEKLIKKHCPNGVEYRKIKETFQRLKGTPITAAKMKDIDNPNGEIKVFAGGKTVISAKEKDIPNANIIRVPAVLVQSRGVIDVIYYEKPFTFKNEMWAYTTDNKIKVKFLYYVLKNNIQKFREAASGMGALPQISLPVTEEFTIPLPPLPVQKEIVRVLDKYSTSVIALQQELTKELTARKKQYEHYRDALLSFDDIRAADQTDNGGGYDNNVIYRKLGEIVKIRNGRDYKSFGSGDIPVYGTSGIMTYVDRYVYDKPTVLIPRKGSIEKLYYVDTPFWNVDTIFYTEIDTSIITPKYLYYLLKKEHLEQYNTAGGVPSLTQSVLNEISLQVPPLETQKRIVSILDKFEMLANSLSDGLPAEIEARKKQYEYYRDKLLDFKDTGEGYYLLEKIVQWLPLGEIATEMYRGAGIKRDEVTEEGIPCVRYGEIYTTYDIWFDECVSYTDEDKIPSKKYFEHGDILFAITGESVEEIARSCAYVGNERCLAGGDIVVMKHKQNPKYLAYALSTTDAQRQKSKGKIKSKVVHASVPSISSIVIPLPPLAIQGWIAEILDKFHSLATDISEGIPAEIEARKKQYEYYRDKLLAFKKIENVV